VYCSAVIQRKHPFKGVFAKKGGQRTRKTRCATRWSSAPPHLTEEDPPGAEHGTGEDKNGTHDDDDNKRLPNCGIESAQGSSRPIHPVFMGE